MCSCVNGGDGFTGHSYHQTYPSASVKYVEHCYMSLMFQESC